MSWLTVLVLYQGMIKIVGGIRLKPLNVESRLKHTVFSGFGRCVKGINVYVYTLGMYILKLF